MSKILFIVPPVTSNRNQKNPPMGALYLAAYLRRQNPSRTFRIVDMVLEQQPPDRIDGVLREFQPDICGITCLTAAAVNAFKVARRIKLWNKDCPVIIGGPHPSFMPETVFDEPAVDYCVMGEGEQSMANLVAALETGSVPHDLEGVGFRGHSGMRCNPPPLPIDTIPWPAYDLIDVQRYHRSPFLTHLGRLKYPEYMTILSSRACPYGCIYCHNIFGKKFRARDAEDFVEEMVMLNKDYGVRDFHIIDDVFNLKRDRALHICELLQKRLPGIAISFPNGLRTDLLDKEVLTALKKAGLYLFAAGIESADPEIQKLINKNLDIGKAFNAIEEAARLGIVVHGFFMMGFPGETEKQLQATIEFARKSRLNTAGFFAVTVYPRTQLFDLAVKMGLTLKTNFDLYNYHTISVNLTQVSDQRLQELRAEAYRRFYLNPRRIFNIITMTPRKIDIWRNIKYSFKNFM